MTIIDRKYIDEALRMAYDKLLKNADNPMSEASIEARTAIDCFEYVLEHCISIKEPQLW